MTPARRRWTTLAASTALALLAGWAWHARREPVGNLQWAASNFGDAQRLYAEWRAASSTDDPQPDLPWLQWPYHLPAQVVSKLLPQVERGDRRYDPWCYYIYAPHQKMSRVWPEHPDGRYEKRAGSLGIRRETELASEKPRLRVLVAGDSHVDGVCNPAEGFPMLLEPLLEESLGTGGVEVINAGHGGYSFHQYLGTFERFVALGYTPDVFVMTVFCGNDFSGPLLLHCLFEGLPLPQRPRARRVQMLEADAAERAAFGQCLMGAETFRTHPEQVDTMQDVVRELTTRLRARCDQTGTRLLVALLPSPSELPEQAHHALIESAAAQLELEPRDLERLSIHRRRYVEWLGQEGIAHLDLFEPFQGHTGLLFWKADLHLNLDGHALAARLLAPRIESLAAGR